jgi:hypothetical protein
MTNAIGSGDVTELMATALFEMTLSSHFRNHFHLETAEY